MKRKRKVVAALAAVCLLGVWLLYTSVYSITLRLKREQIDHMVLSFEGRTTMIEDMGTLNTLVSRLNRLHFRPYRNMSHLDPRSGVTTVSVFDASDTCRDVFWFYDWAYRGGEHTGKTRQEGEYLMPAKDPQYFLTQEYLTHLLSVHADQ